MLRTVALWVVLIVMFMAFYTLFAGRSDGSGEELGTGARVAAQWAPILFIGLFAGTFWIFLRRARGAQQELLRGVAQLQEGAFVRALATFDGVAGRMPRAKAVHYYRGLALVSLWRVEEAERAFSEASRKPGVGESDLSRLLLPMWALCDALLGRRDPARQRLAQAEVEGAGSTGQGTLANLVLAVRAGDWQAARVLTQRFELTQLGGFGRGLSDALAAWTAEQLDGARPAVHLVPLLGETGLPEVRKVWPELGDFLGRATAGQAPSRGPPGATTAS